MKKRIISMIMAALMVVTVFTTGFAAATEAQAEEYTLPEYIEFQRDNPGYLPAEKDGVVYNFYKDILGFGVIMPYIEWNGGITYTEQINLRIAAGDAPDVYAVVNGMENQLINDGAILDLTDYLQEYAPHCWELVGEDVWNFIRKNDPTGQNRIWYVPKVFDYQRHGAMIRQDWLDKLGLKMPTTQDELVEVLRAFKTGDPNGNGIADEIPTGGREEARWMDFLFYEYGIAMFEGYPGWDLYDGELTYSAVTPNMKDALQWLSQLYAEGLIDPETLFNDKTSWDGKVSSDRVGIFYHLPREHYTAVSDHVLEQGEFFRCKLDGLPRTDYRPGRSVDCQVRYGILVGLIPGILACHYLDHGAELIKAERLGKIVIASGTKAGNLVSYAVSCGKKEHRRNAPLGP